jgi:pimeloyl-ACP methyl ester carboxylesterase
MPILEEKTKKICYETFGDSDKPCLALIAGFGAQLLSWSEELIEGLVAAGFYVVIFDNRDVGLSSYYDDLDTPIVMEAIAKLQQGQAVSSPYSLRDMADDVVTLMDGLQIAKAHIAGISMGGQIAQVFAVAHSDRTLSLTVIASGSGEPGLPPPNDAVMDFFFSTKDSATSLESAIERHIEQHKIYYHPDDFDFELSREKLETSYRRAYHPAGNQRQLLAMICAEPRTEALKQLTVPLLVIHGDYDPVFPAEHGRQLASLVDHAHLEMIKDMGHGLPKRVHQTILESMKKMLLKAS